MEKSSCSQLKIQLQEIKSLKAEFDFKVDNIKVTRNTAPIYELEKEIKEKIISARENQYLKIYIAEQIFGKDFLGPDAIKTAFDFTPKAKDIPDIPFSLAEIERAKELGQFLVLRINKTPDGRPLTMKKMNELKGRKTKDGGKILYNSDWYKDEKFFTTDTPSLGWALVSKQVIPNITNKNYLEQTEEIVNYLETEVFKDQPMSLECKEAIDEFNRDKEEIQPLMESNWKLAAKKLAQLKVNRLFRNTPSEVLYDVLLRKEKGSEYPVNFRIWTSSRGSNGRLVDLGGIDFDGVGVYSHPPHFSVDFQGACFSRSR